MHQKLRRPGAQLFLSGHFPAPPLARRLSAFKCFFRKNFDRPLRRRFPADLARNVRVRFIFHPPWLVGTAWRSGDGRPIPRWVKLGQVGSFFGRSSAVRRPIGTREAPKGAGRSPASTCNGDRSKRTGRLSALCGPIREPDRRFPSGRRTAARRPPEFGIKVNVSASPDRRRCPFRSSPVPRPIVVVPACRRRRRRAPSEACGVSFTCP